MALALASVLVSACAETPRAGFKRDYAAKRFRNPPFDRANIYVYRLTGSSDADLLLGGSDVALAAGLAAGGLIGAALGAGYGELSLDRVEPDDGKEGVRRCTLVADRPPPLPPPTP